MADLLRLTYRELGDRLGLTPDGARFLARRRLWRIESGNDGRKMVLVAEPELDTEADRLARSSPDHRPMIPASDRESNGLVAELRDRLGHSDADRERLVGELAELRRERDDLAGAGATARERAARAEGEVTALRDALRDLAGRLNRAEENLAMPFWRRWFRGGDRPLVASGHSGIAGQASTRGTNHLEGEDR